MTTPLHVTRKNIITALGFTILTGGLTACGPAEEEQLNQEISPTTVQQALTQNTDAMARGVSEAIAFIKDSELAMGAWNGASTSCTYEDVYDERGEWIDSTETCVPVELNTDLAQPSQELTELLKNNIFTQDNIESQLPREITFLLKGANVCKLGDEPAEASCVDFVDRAKLRVVVTSPAANDLDMKLLVGDARTNPVSLELHQQKLAVVADLGAVRPSIQAIATALGEPIPDELPETLSGKVRAQLSRPAAKKLEATFSVLSPIKIADADYDIQVAQASPAMKLTVDGDAKKVQQQINWSAIQAKFPFWEHQEIETTETDEFGNQYTSYESKRTKKHSAQISLGGANGTLIFDAANELLSAAGLGLGDATSTVKIDGQQVLSLDLNPSAGRRVDVSLAQGPNDTQTLEIAPSLDLKLVMTFQTIKAAFDELDVADWMLNDTWQIKADGATPVRLSVGEQLKVLAGKLTMSSSAAQLTHAVNADQCIGSIEQPEPGPSEEDSGGPVQPEVGHPMQELEVQACR